VGSAESGPPFARNLAGCRSFMPFRSSMLEGGNRNVENARGERNWGEYQRSPLAAHSLVQRVVSCFGRFAWNEELGPLVVSYVVLHLSFCNEIM